MSREASRKAAHFGWALLVVSLLLVAGGVIGLATVAGVDGSDLAQTVRLSGRLGLDVPAWAALLVYGFSVLFFLASASVGVGIIASSRRNGNGNGNGNGR